MLELILLAVAGIFLVIIGIKKVFSIKVCALCGAIVLTWVGLLFLYRIGYFHDVALLSLLMGQSVAGIYYAVDKRVVPALRIFTLPFFLSLTFIFYVLVVGVDSILPPLLVLLILWIIAYIVFAYRKDPGKKSLTDAVMNCCEDK